MSVPYLPAKSTTPLFRMLLGVVVLITSTAVEAADIDPWILWAGPTMLRGANIYQRKVYPELDGEEFMGSGPFGPPYTQEDFTRLAALGANYVNLSVAGIFTKDPPYTVDTGAQADLDSLLAMAENAGLFAVISFRTGPGRSDFSVCCHGDDWYDPEVYEDDSVWSNPEAQDAWVDMWTYTAARYASNPVVVGYDLMVEPNSNEVLYDEWDPEEFYTQYSGTLADWRQLYPRIIEAIREVDRITPILVQPNGYAAVDWLPYMETVADPRTIYAVHQYEPYVYTHQSPPLENRYPGTFDTDDDGTKEIVDRSWLDQLLKTIDAFSSEYGTRCVVNEMGVQRWEPGAEIFLSDEIALLEERGLNWAVWAWEPAWEPWAEDVTDFNFRLGPDPSNVEDVPGNALETVLHSSWTSNLLHPGESDDTFLLPAAANLPGDNETRWRTELQLKAIGGSNAVISIALLERDRENPAPESRILSLPEGRSIRVSNVLEELFAYEGAAALLLTPLSGQFIAGSRTCTGDVSSGTFGQYIAAVPVGDAAAWGQSVEFIQLSGQTGESGMRTNLGIINPEMKPEDVLIEVFSAQGNSLGTIRLQLGPWEYRQLNRILSGISNGDVPDAWIRIRTETPGGALHAYASVIDNVSGDSILISGHVVTDRLKNPGKKYPGGSHVCREPHGILQYR